MAVSDCTTTTRSKSRTPKPAIGVASPAVTAATRDPSRNAWGLQRSDLPGRAFLGPATAHSRLQSPFTLAKAPACRPLAVAACLAAPDGLLRLGKINPRSVSPGPRAQPPHTSRRLRAASVREPLGSVPAD